MNIFFFFKIFSPKPAPPTPPPEPEWSSVKSAVKHLTDSDFKSQLSKYKSTLVMFYAPWCGHCKKTKPDFQNAADSLKDKNKAFAAVDCTKHRGKLTPGVQWGSC